MSGAKLATSRTMTVSVGSASKNVTLPVNKTSASGSVSLTYTPSNNDRYEGDRSVPVTGRAGDVPVTGTSLTIKEDEDPPTVSFSSSSRTVDEDSGTVSLTVALSGASGQAVTVDYATADGTAKAGSDYTGTSGTLTFSAGEKSKTVSISITNDSIDEDNEPLTVSLSDPSGATLGSTDEATVTIIDDDLPPKISLSSSSRTVSEDAGTVGLTVRLSQGSGKPVKVDYATTDGTASSGSDYTAKSGTVTFAPGESSQTISVSIKDDSTDEPDENFMVRLSSPSNATLGSTDEATLTIKDDDPAPTITVSPSSRTVSEGAGRVRLSVSLSEESGKEVRVSYATADGTASAGSDYTARSGTLTYAPGQDEKTISVDVLEDSAYEYDEDFTVRLSRPSNATLGSTSSSTVTIRDNDDPDVTVSYVSANYQATEGGSSATVTVRLSARPERSVTIPIRVTRKAGASSGDYSGIPLSVTFGSSDRSKTFTVTATDDTVDDDGEWLELSFGALPSGVTEGSVATERVDLIDNDVPSVTVSYASADYQATEGGSSATVTVILSAQPERSVTIPIAAAGGGGATANDYELSASSVTFSATQTSRTFTVKANDDSVDDDGEWVSLSFGKLPDGVTEGGIATERVDLIDDDPDPAVTLALSSATIRESGGKSTVTASVSHASSAATTVTVSASPVSPAKAGDFTQSGTTLTIAAGETASSGVVTIKANGNAIDEDDRQVTVSARASNPQGVAGDPAAVTLTIEDDDDPPAVSLSSSSIAVDEDTGSVSLTASLGEVSGKQVTVGYATANGTATSGSDYTAISGTLTFAAGTKSQTVSVAIVEDSVYEPDETFTVTLSRPSNATLGSPASATVTIRDNDLLPVTVSYASAAYQATEGGAGATVTVNLSAQPERQVVIPIAAAPQDGATAQGQPGADYSGIPASVTFGATDTSKTFTVAATDDSVDDDGEWVSLSFGALPDGVTAGSVSTERVDLIDDDAEPRVTLALSPAVISENDGVSTVTASLSHPSGADTTLTVRASPAAPAKAGDFTLSGTTLTIAAGETDSAGSVTITAVDNAVHAPDKSVTVSATARNPQGVADLSDATLTIEEDDLALSVAFSAASYEAAEGGAGAEVTVQLDKAPGREVAIPIQSAAEDGATAQGQTDADYSGIPANVTFGATDTSKTFTVTATDDSVDDDGEWVSLSFGSLPDGVTAGSVSTSRVDLTDDEAEPRVTLTLSPTSITESGGVSTVTASLSHPSGADTTLTVRASPTAPAEAGDFTLSGTTLTIAAGETDSTGNVTITAVDNAVHAPDKSVTVSATASNPQGVADLSDATLTIEEDDVRGVQISVSDLSLYEGESGAYTVGLASQPTADVTVELGLAAQLQADVSPTPWRLTFTPENWDTGQTVTIEALDDSDAGSGEVEVTHFVGGGDYGANGVTAPDVTVWVSDDDVTASFSQAAYTATEGRSPAAVEVTLNAAPGREVVIPVMTATQGGATSPGAEGADYSGVPEKVTFARDEQSKTFVVAATDDETAEEGERVELRFASLPKGIAASGYTAATIHLKDDPGPASTQVTLSVSPSSVAESAGATPLTVTGTLDGAPLTEEAVVSLWLTPGPETEEADYEAAEALLKITAGETRGEAAITLAPVNDTIVEGVETVGVDGLVSVGRADSTMYVTPANVTIDDDDTPSWAVTLSPSTIAESGGSATLTISTGGVTYETDQILDLAYSGSATLGTDFNAPGSVTLAHGADSVTAKVTTVADSVSDPDETITVTANHDDAPIGTAELTLTEGVCGRTEAVRDALVAAITGVSACEGVTAAHLSGITELDFFGGSATALTLQSGDFAGLSGLQTLILKSVTLSSLPSNVFDGLTSLSKLNLKNTGLTALPSGVFDDLRSLTELTLENNPLGSLDADTFKNLSNLRMLNLRKTRLSALPGGLFGNLSALTELNLRGNVLTTLAADAFGGLTSLQTLNLISNRLTAIPDGLFEGLTQLTTVRLDGNAGSPFPLKVRLEKVGDDQIKAVLPSGAPFAITVPLSVSGPATIHADQVTIATGAVESDPVTISRNAGTTDAVTADIGTLPALPGTEHQGYALTRSADLPLAVLAEVAVSPMLSVSDPAEVKEGNTSIPFTVTLTPAASGTVTVDYATHDGTATAGEDYTAVTGTLTFAAGDTSKTVTVTVLNDVVDEGKETFTLKLSNPEGATVSDGEATATIANSDPIPQAWLVRFGRTVAGHVAEGVSERLTQAEHVPAQATFAGIRLPLGDARSSPAVDTSLQDQLGRPWDGGNGWPHQGGFTLKQPGQPPAAGMPGGAAGASRGVTSRDLLLGSAFTVALERKEDDARFTLWGRGMATRFDGAEEELRLDGEAATYLLGVDRAWGRWLTGVALAHSRGAGGYNASTASERGDIQSTLTSVHPYARYAVSERITAWGVLGYGQGALTLNRQGAGSWNTDTSMTMAAAGARGVLKPAAYTGGLELAVRTDALFARTVSSDSENDTGRLAGSDGHAQRLRLMLEGSRSVSIGARTLTPTVELGLRHDAGDAETGTGVEIGAGLRFDDPTRGLSIAVKARGLIAHQDAGYREWGASAAIRLDPGTPGQGLLLTLTPSWGDAMNGAERLWAQPGQDRIAYPNRNPAGRMDAELSYVSNGPRGIGRQSPYAALSLGDIGGRALRLGWRLAAGPRGNVNVEAIRRQTGRNGDAAEHGVLLRAAMRW